MKLRTKTFPITDAKGNDIDLSGKPVIIILNGELTDIHLHDLVSSLELDENEIYGNSMLSYYTPQDGKLVVEGSTIELAIEGTDERILITGINRPGIHADTMIPFEHVQKFAEFFKVAKPDEVFTDLNAEEKQFFIDARTTAASKAKAAADKASAEKAIADKAAADAAAKQAETELRASIDLKFIHDKKSYMADKTFYDLLEPEPFKEYIKGPYHLFFGKSTEEAPYVLIKRGNDWWEQPKDTDLADENDKTVEVQFTDGKILKSLILDIATGEITITDVE